MTDADYQAVGLTRPEYQALTGALRREPTPLELGLVGALWSEHCSYKSSRSTLQWFQGADRLGANAGVVPLDPAYEIAFKVESHNHPSFVEPLHGAATGVGGIIRDILAMGAEPIALLDSLRFGPGAEGRRLMPRVVDGIAFYGNAVGVPTVGGEIKVGPGYETNPLVNVMCVGLRRRTRPIGARVEKAGAQLVLVGQRTGRDGIHGASLLASRVFSAGGPDARPQVQVGDPFYGKLVIEAVLSALETGLVEAVQDCGAAGLSSALSEMAAQSELGVQIDVDRVPRRETGMTAYEVMLSESQERMVLACRAEAVSRLMEVLRPWDVPCAVIGLLTADTDMVVTDDGKELARLPVGLLTHGCPIRPALERSTFPVEAEAYRSLQPLEPDEALRVLGHPDCQSRSEVYTQYDYMVKTSTVAGPGSDAAVLRIRASEVGLALTTDGQGRWGAVDAYAGGARAVVEAAMNCAVSGATPLALSDGLNAGNPNLPAVFRQFSAMVAGIADTAAALGIPVTGGNVSFYNETDGRAIWPTPVIGMVGRHDRPLSPIPMGLPHPGLLLYRVGDPPNDLDLAASVWRLACGDGAVGAASRPDVSVVRRVLAFLQQAADARVMAACHDVSDGGLFVALAEMLLNAGPGVRWLTVDRFAGDPHLFWFGEPSGTAVAAIAPDAAPTFLALAVDHGVEVGLLGSVPPAQDGRDPGIVWETATGPWHWGVPDLRVAWGGDAQREAPDGR